MIPLTCGFLGQVNIADGLSTRVTMHQCRGCLKFMGGSGGSGWAHYELESRELLAVCLRKVNGLSRLRLIDAGWIWTEPHSKRCAPGPTEWFCSGVCICYFLLI
jgi:NMD protein affecting ribosome stability and mRNA decay